MSWIDPNFIDLNILDPNSNDDHPPTDIRAGQAFILQIYEALTRSPNWEDTLLVIVYDEHGGFYDHVSPPAVNDGSGYSTLGVRVPAIVVGPRVRQSVCHETLDHTVPIKTILTRFAKNTEQTIQRMGTRVQTRSTSASCLNPNRVKKLVHTTMLAPRSTNGGRGRALAVRPRLRARDHQRQTEQDSR